MGIGTSRTIVCLIQLILNKSKCVACKGRIILFANTDYMKNIRKLLPAFIVGSVLIVSCGGGAETGGGGLMPTEGQITKAKGSSNAISQSMPSIMVLPSDGLLQRLGYLEQRDSDGVTQYVRDYQGAFINDAELKFAVAAIQEDFANIGFPLEDLEQQLKNLQNANAMDEATGVWRDARAELLNTARPDYIMELDYQMVRDDKARTISEKLNYVVKCIDAYTVKSIASVSRDGLGDGSGSLASLLKADFAASLPQVQSQITNHYADLLANGVEITFRIAIDQGSALTMEDECGGDELGANINAWMKENTVNQSFKMQKNTGSEMAFTSVRIFSHDENGGKITAYDFADDLRKLLKRSCGMSVSNRTQSIGDALIVIK